MSLLDVAEKGTAINSVTYVASLQRLKSRMHRVRPENKMKNVLLLHDNTRVRTSDAITELCRAVIPSTIQPRYAPSDFHLTGSLKNVIRGHRDDDAVIAETDPEERLPTVNTGSYFQAA
jgi:hypothetical protein